MPTKTEIRQALWSVQYNTQFRRRSGAMSTVVSDTVRQHLIPIALVRALEILVKAYDEHDFSRRRRAFVKIGAAGLFDPERARAFFESDADVGLFLDLVLQLGQSLHLSNIQEVLAQRPHDINAYLNQELRLASGPAACSLDNPTCVACLDGKTWRTTVTATTRVGRPIEELDVVFDPRSWAQCGDVFEATEVVEWDNDADLWVPIPGTYGLPPIGSPWNTAQKTPADPELGLRENVIVGATAAKGSIAEFVNVLDIDFIVSHGNANPADDEIRVNYSLSDSVSSVIFGQPLTGGLLNDHGHLLARRDAVSPADWTYVEVVKTVRFADLTAGGGAVDYGELLNYTAAGILCLWLEDTSEMSPCCEVP